MRWLGRAVFLGCVLVLAGAAPAFADGDTTDTCFPPADGSLGCDDGVTGDSGIPSGFVVLIVVFLLIGVGVTIYKVSMARDMARRSGMDEDDATAMTLLDDNGLSATYLASNLRPPAGASPPASPRPVSERLAELESLRDQRLVTQAEYDERRAAILKSL